MRPELAVCPCCGGEDRIGVHSRTDRRFRCHDCGRTFSETNGTPLYNLKYPIWLVLVVLTLLSHGCPVKAIVAAFKTDERTVMDWLRKAGRHGKCIQEWLTSEGDLKLEQVQADELCITAQIRKVWMATAMLVRSVYFFGAKFLHRVHETLGTTPAVKTGKASRPWSIFGILFSRPGAKTFG